MKRILVGIGAVLAIASLVAVFDQSRVKPTDYDVVAPDSKVWAEPEITNALTDAVDAEFNLNINRLYDIAYEVDPALNRFAASINKTPACVIDLARQVVDGLTTEPARCNRQQDSNQFSELMVTPGTYGSECRVDGDMENCRRVQISPHPYEAYSDLELRALASTSPDAAVILARRLDDERESESLYEQAAVLSGRPGPLEEWMLRGNRGVLVRQNGVLDIEKAALGYEIYLTAARLGHPADAVADYEAALRQENVDLAAIRARSDARYARMTNARLQLINSEWEG